MKILRKSSVPIMEVKKSGEMEYLTFPALDKTEIVAHLFSTRIGGASRGIYSTVNFHYEMGDQKDCVDENYRRVSMILGQEGRIDHFVLGQQTHTVNIRTVTEKDMGKGVIRERDYSDVDALITNIPGIILTTFHADCTPVYIVDPANKAIGLCHSGWKGTVGKISEKALQAMNREYGTDPSKCICAIGPSICRDCYEVGGELIEIFQKEFSNSEELYTAGKNGKFYLDLWAANKSVLMQAGVPKENISTTDICTRCNPDYLFSHRITGFQRGTCAAFLCIKE